MIGFHIFPEAARERYPGQVPRLVARKTAAADDGFVAKSATGNPEGLEVSRTDAAGRRVLAGAVVREPARTG